MVTNILSISPHLSRYSSLAFAVRPPSWTPSLFFHWSIQGAYTVCGSAAFYRLALRNGLLVLLLLLFGAILRLPLPSGTSWVLFWLLITVFTGSVRFTLRDLFLKLRSPKSNNQLRVAIYGAGKAGVQLASALRFAGSHRIVSFIDENPVYWNRTIYGVSIQPPQVLQNLVDSIDQVLLAIPSLSRSERRRIVDHLQSLGVVVLQVPAVDDLISGRARINSLRPIAIEDLLGRDEVQVDPHLYDPGIFNSVVCVTGAGGSIGSELCRQILSFSPAKLILLEISEPALYAIDQDLRSYLPEGVAIQAVLGSAADPYLMSNLFRDEHVEHVFHAAAYKHVPLVEANPLAGLANNVGSTFQVCRAAEASAVRQVVLISTDKAVRPTNVMGASKRVAELVVQAFAAGSTCTRFSMVRFGNVLGSSGSVVPLFRRQIADGGPITLTHPEIIRYFMTIPEAASLVLHSSMLAQGGDVFLLDMGEPVRIKNLAEQMVQLSGLSLRDAAHPDGDIEIVYTGLRPGEKLYEELLIDAESQATSHPLIYRALEKSLSPEQLLPQLNSLQAAITSQDVEGAFKYLARLVPEWRRASSCVDSNRVMGQ